MNWGAHVTGKSTTSRLSWLTCLTCYCQCPRLSDSNWLRHRRTSWWQTDGQINKRNKLRQVIKAFISQWFDTGTSRTKTKITDGGGWSCRPNILYTYHFIYISSEARAHSLLLTNFDSIWNQICSDKDGWMTPCPFLSLLKNWFVEVFLTLTFFTLTVFIGPGPMRRTN